MALFYFWELEACQLNGHAVTNHVQAPNSYRVVILILRTVASIQRTSFLETQNSAYYEKFNQNDMRYLQDAVSPTYTVL